MSINRYNYEEFFILYMDNELAAADRKLVEDFVQQHTDLKEELDLLMQFKLTPDTSVTYAGKEELMMPALDGIKTNNPVNLSNYEEWLILYIDNELNSEQKIFTEKFLAANPSVQKEFTLLQQSKLQPEEIVFAGKELLYREEEKVRKMPARWWRAAAAVLILAFGLSAVIISTNKSGNKGGEVATVPVNQQNIPLPLPVPEQKNTEAQMATTTTPVENAVTEKINQPVTPKEPEAAVAVNNSIKKYIPVTIKKQEALMAVNDDKFTNNLPQPVDPTRIVTGIGHPIDIAIAANPKNPLTNQSVTNKNPQPSDIASASFKNDDADFDQPDGKKNKLRGFLRKVTRTFEKRTNIDATDDDDRLLVAGLSFKLK